MAAQRRSPRNPARNTTEQPATAPLEAPMKSQTAPDAVEPVPTVADVGVQMVKQAIHPIVDQETGLPPVIEGLFKPLAPHSTIRVCTRRLLENDESGMVRLLLPAGAQVSLEQAMGVLEVLAAAQGAVTEVELPEEVVEVVDASGEVVAVIEADEADEAE